MARKIIITVGRQFGSGGKAVAEELGRRLGIPVYDSELLSRAAEESGLGKESFSRRDEKRNIFKIGFSSLAGGGSNADVLLFRIQSQTIANIAEQGPAVIVGRCSDYVLRDLDCTLDVFLTAPLESRVERVCARMGIAPDQARSLIEKKDRARASYYNYFTLGDWGVASTYDLCLDTSMLGIEGTAGFIIDFARKAGLIDE